VFYKLQYDGVRVQQYRTKCLGPPQYRTESKLVKKLPCVWTEGQDFPPYAHFMRLVQTA